jgi:hypothetical protein
MLLEQYGGTDKNQMYQRADLAKNMSGAYRPQWTQGIIVNVTEENHIKQRYSVELSTIGRKNIINAVPVQTFISKNGEGEFRPLKEGQLVSVIFKENQETKPVIVLSHSTNGPSTGIDDVWANGNYPAAYNPSYKEQEYDPPFVSPQVIQNPTSKRTTYLGNNTEDNTKEIKYLELIDSNANISVSHIGTKTELSKYGTVNSTIKDQSTVLDSLYTVLFDIQNDIEEKKKSYQIIIQNTNVVSKRNYLTTEQENVLEMLKHKYETQLENIRKHQEAITDRQKNAQEAIEKFGANSIASIENIKINDPSRNALSYLNYSGIAKQYVQLVEGIETRIKGAENILPLITNHSSMYTSQTIIKEIALLEKENITDNNKNLNDLKKAISTFNAS